MAATQYITGVYDKLSELLTAHTAYSSQIRVANRIDWTTGRAIVKKTAGQRAPADFPSDELMVGGSTDTGFSLSRHYGMKTTASNISSLTWTERETHNFKLRISSAVLNVATLFLLVAEAKTAIRKGGPRLQLDYVFQREGMTASDPMEELDDNGRPRLLVCELTIPVTFTFDGQDLLT